MRNKFAIVFVGRVLQVVISFITIKYLTNTLSKENVAKLFLINAILNYFGISLVSPIGQFMNRYLNTWSNEKTMGESFLNYILYVLFIATLSVPFIFGLNHFGFFSDLLFPYFFLYLFGLILFSNINTYFVANFNLLGKPIFFVIYTNLWLALGFLMSWFFIERFGPSVDMWLLGLLLSHGLFSTCSFIHLCRKFNISFSFQTWRETLSTQRLGGVLKFSLPLLFSTLLMWLTTESHRFVIEAQHGLVYLGLFSIGFTISQKLSYAVESVVSQVFIPRYYEQISNTNAEGRSKAWLKYFYISSPFYVAILLLSVVFSKPLILLFSSSEYLEASQFLVSGAFFNFFRKLTATYAMIAHGEENTKLLIVPYFVGALGATCAVYFGHSMFSIGPQYMLPVASLSMLVVIFLRTKNLINGKMNVDGFLKEIRSLISTR
jgi:O-antigen/teichoic acid export membrane protein